MGREEEGAAGVEVTGRGHWTWWYSGSSCPSVMGATHGEEKCWTRAFVAGVAVTKKGFCGDWKSVAEAECEGEEG